jgi:hypothetical protein
MQYALLIHADPAAVRTLSEEEQTTVTKEYLALMDDPRLVGSTRLQPGETATCVRVADGRTVLSDGPFADTKEVLGGVAVIEAADLDEALEMAARIPAARFGGVVEVRPVAQS